MVNKFENFNPEEEWDKLNELPTDNLSEKDKEILFLFLRGWGVFNPDIFVNHLKGKGFVINKII